MNNISRYLCDKFHVSIDKAQIHQIFSDKTPFYLLATISLFVTIVLSLIGVFVSDRNTSDFYPKPGIYYGVPVHDKTVIDKLTHYFSQFTHHTLFLLFFYFLSSLFNYNSTTYFKIIAPIALTISILYFYYLFPKQGKGIHELTYSNLYSHFMIIILVLCEFYYIDGIKLRETTYCLVFLVTAVLVTILNFLVRGVWTYNLVKLDRPRGWKMICQTIILMYSLSLLFYFVKPIHEPLLNYYKYAPFYSSLVNIVFTLIFIHFNP